MIGGLSSFRSDRHLCHDLPGISGAFILLLLGKYEYIITAVSEFNIPVLLTFLVGAVAGIVAFSHLLSWLLKNYHGMTVALLTGFMVGSLNKIWPWKITDTELVNGIAFDVEKNVPLIPSSKLTGAILLYGRQSSCVSLVFYSSGVLKN